MANHKARCHYNNSFCQDKCCQLHVGGEFTSIVELTLTQLLLENVSSVRMMG